jgi:DNA-binding IclR family transcriptional regulator
MAQNSDYSNNPDPNGELAPSTKTSTEETPLEVFAEVVETALEAVEENPTSRWMEIAAPIMKSGGKTVAVILALGFISIPLMISGSPWVALVLAAGASITAICSCLMVAQ